MKNTKYNEEKFNQLMHDYKDTSKKFTSTFNEIMSHRNFPDEMIMTEEVTKLGIKLNEECELANLAMDTLVEYVNNL